MSSLPILRHATAAARTAAMASITTAMLSRTEIILRFTPPEERDALLARHLRRWASIQLRVMGIDLRIDRNISAATGGRLVVSSHRSAVDILIAISLFGGRILSRGDLANWPVAGRLAKRIGTLFVDRDSRASGAAAIRQIRRALVAGDTIIVFPEGTTYPGDEVRPFKAGVFAAVSRLDIEIVPMGVACPPGVEWYHESFGSHFGRVIRRRTTPIGVALGSPRRTAGMKASELATALHEEVQALTYAARALC